jgi:hypothetical protein
MIICEALEADISNGFKESTIIYMRLCDSKTDFKSVHKNRNIDISTLSFRNFVSVVASEKAIISFFQKN